MSNRPIKTQGNFPVRELVHFNPQKHFFLHEVNLFIKKGCDNKKQSTKYTHPFEYFGIPKAHAQRILKRGQCKKIVVASRNTKPHGYYPFSSRLEGNMTIEISIIVGSDLVHSLEPRIKEDQNQRSWEG